MSALLMLGLTVRSSRAAVPAQIGQMGRLLTASGAPATGTVMLTFAVYDSASSTTPLWTETQSVDLADGYFAVQLGTVTAFPANTWDGTLRYLGVKVNSDSEMTPREVVSSVPYALVANDAVGDLHPTSVTVGGTPVIDARGFLLVGSAGPTGAKGPTGAAGPPGVPGLDGATGPQGVAGLQGPTGAQGPVGVTGPQGLQGATGLRGATGSVGPAGGVGAAGPQGATGSAGAVGASPPAFFRSSFLCCNSATLPTTSNILTYTFTAPVAGKYLARATGICSPSMGTSTFFSVILEISTASASWQGTPMAALAWEASQSPNWESFATEREVSAVAGQNTLYLIAFPWTQVGGTTPSVNCGADITVTYSTGDLP